MPDTSHFKRLLADWQSTTNPSSLQSFDTFYLAQWVQRQQQLQESFWEELEDNLLQISEPEAIKYLTYLATKLTALSASLALLPTAAPTYLLAAFQAQRPLQATAFYEQVSSALAKPGKALATPPYDDEAAARPFQHEYVQVAFLAVYHRVSEALRTLTAPLDEEAFSSATTPPLILKVDMADLVDLIDIMVERGDWAWAPNVTRKEFCRRLATLFKMPPSERGSTAPDWKRYYDVSSRYESDKAKTRTNRSKKGLYNAIKPPEKP